MATLFILAWRAYKAMAVSSSSDRTNIVPAYPDISRTIDLDAFDFVRPLVDLGELRSCSTPHWIGMTPLKPLKPLNYFLPGANFDRISAGISNEERRDRWIMEALEIEEKKHHTDPGRWWRINRLCHALKRETHIEGLPTAQEMKIMFHEYCLEFYGAYAPLLEGYDDECSEEELEEAVKRWRVEGVTTEMVKKEIEFKVVVRKEEIREGPVLDLVEIRAVLQAMQ